MEKYLTVNQLHDLMQFEKYKEKRLAIAQIKFDIYTTSQGTGSQSFDIQIIKKNHDNLDDFIEDNIIDVLKKYNLLPDHLLLQRHFDSFGTLDADMPGKIAMTGIIQETFCDTGLGSFSRYALILFDVDTILQYSSLSDKWTLAQKYE